MNEYLRLTEEAQHLLTKTAVEQDLIDGGDGKVLYYFTFQDAVEAEVDWGASGSDSNLNVRTLFVSPKI